MAVFWLTQRSEIKLPGASISLCLLGLGFALLCLAPAILYHPDTSGLPKITRTWAWGLPAALIVYVAINLNEPTGRIGRALVLLGDASYALYLTHIFVIIAYGRLLKSAPIAHLKQIFLVPLMVCLAIVLGVITHLFVERPLLRFTRTFITQTASNPVPAN